MSDETDVYTLDASGAVAALNAVRDASNETTSAVKEGNESQTESFFKAEAAIELLKQGWERLIEIVKESINAYAETDKAERQLTQVAGENAEAFERQARTFQDTLGVNEDMVMSLQTLALRYGAMPGQVEALTKAVLDYSSATGMDATSAMRMLLNSAEQGTDGLKRMGVQYKSTGEFTADLTLATQALADKYGGAASAAADSLAGKQAKLGLQIEATEKAFGKFIATLNSSTGILDKVTKAMNEYTFIFSKEYEQQTQSVARREQLTMMMEAEMAARQKLTTVTGIEYELEKSDLEALQRKIAAMKEWIKSLNDAAVAATTEEKKEPTGEGDPHATAKAQAAAEAAAAERVRIQAALAKNLEDSSVNLWVTILDIEEKAQAQEKKDWTTQSNILLQLSKDSAAAEVAEHKRLQNQLHEERGKEMDKNYAEEMAKQKKIDDERIAQAKKTYDTLSGFAIDFANVGLDQLKTLETANQYYTSKVNDANVQQRAIAQATAELQQKYSDQQLKNMSDQQYAAALGAQADKDRAGITQQLAAGQAAAFEQTLAAALASVGEQAAVKALFELAEGLAATAGIYTAALAPGHYAAAAEYAAVAAAAGVGSYAISQSRGLTTEESDNLTSLNASNATALNTPYSGSSSGSGSAAAAPGTVANGAGTGNTTINVYGIAGYTTAQQAKALADLQRQYAKLKTGSGG